MCVCKSHMHASMFMRECMYLVLTLALLFIVLIQLGLQSYMWPVFFNKLMTVIKCIGNRL